MSHFKEHLLNALLAALGFGLGFIAGGLITSLTANIGLLAPIQSQFEAGQLIVGVALTILIVGLGGAVGGALGGLALSYASRADNRWAYSWRSALSFGFSYAVILVPVVITVSMIALYQFDESAPVTLMIPFGVAGAIVGLVSGIILGLLTVGWATWRVALTGAIGFGLGGAGMGYSVWGYYLGTPGFRGSSWLPFAGLFAFGVIGGAALGWLYSWLARREPKPSIFARLAAWFKRSGRTGQFVAGAGLLVLLLALRGLWVISPFSAEAAPLSSVLASNTIDTHWSPPAPVAELGGSGSATPALFANEAGSAAIAWSQGPAGQSGVYYAVRAASENSWSEPVLASTAAASGASQPQLVIDDQDTVHLVWVETEAATGAADILYSQCHGGECDSPERLSDLAGLDCLVSPSTENDGPAIAIDQTGTLMVTWRNGPGSLLYSSWPAGSAAPGSPTGCVPTGAQANSTIDPQPRLSGGADGSFNLTYSQVEAGQGGDVYLFHYTNNSWDGSPQLIGPGHSPGIFTSRTGQIHLAWCGPDRAVNSWHSTGETGTIQFPPCSGRPTLAGSGSEPLRLVWYSDEVETVTGNVTGNQVIYESVKTDTGWTEPSIISQPGGPTQPEIAAGDGQTLHLVWHDTSSQNGGLNYATHRAYDCTGAELSRTGQVVYDTVRQEKFRPPSDIVPYCDNQYDRLIFAPNPEPAFSTEPPTPNGAFDHFVDLARTARYEVVYSTMWYEADVNQDSPGRVVAGAVAELYEALKKDPARYPRGLTVRILLGNPPTFALFPTYNNQVRLVLEDLRSAGITEMENPELGWKLEVGNYRGSWPHGHTKMMVVDGKTVIGAGYNLQYPHYPKEHPSGLGKDKVDLGLQLTGPVAQATLRAYDDLWAASIAVHCTDLDPESRYMWMLSCQTRPATAEHVPEVLRYYVPDSGSAAFSLHRTQKFKEADEAYYQALASAQSSIDIIQVNFTLQVVCDLNVLLEICNFTNRIDPLGGMMTAVENNGARLRILVKEAPLDGIENKIAIKAFRDALEAKGLSDLVEIRFFNADLVHSKTALIDDELLVVGSQNFQYSAWGKNGLTEYSLATEDPEAVEDFQKYFQYEWDRAIPLE